MVCNTEGSIVPMLYILGWLARKLSIEATLSPSKKNCVVISFPSLFTQVLKQPFSITNMVLEISPSSKSVVRAGTSNRWKRCSNFSHLFVFIASDLYRQQFFTFPKKRWVNQYQAKNSRNNDKLQEVMRSHK